MVPVDCMLECLILKDCFLSCWLSFMKKKTVLLDFGLGLGQVSNRLKMIYTYLSHFHSVFLN